MVTGDLSSLVMAVTLSKLSWTSLQTIEAAMTASLAAAA